jgi:hypothetical protein
MPQPIATTRRQLFPEAHDDAQLRTLGPPRIPFSARAWYTFIGGAVILGILIIGFDSIAAHTDAVGINAALGGTGPKISDDGDVSVIAGTWMERLMWGSFAIAIVSYALLRLCIQLSRPRSRRESWANFVAKRGLRFVDGGVLEATALPVFTEGRDRDWTGVSSGQLRGGVQVHVGATAWTTGHGKSQERHHLFFAYVRLPAEVAEVFRGSSLTRFLRGISDVELHPSSYDELRFESISVDNACEIRVKGDAQDVRWRELFEPNTLVGLDELYDGQWQQVGRDMVFVAGGNVHRTAPVDVLDSLCLTAAFMVERFRWAALGDVPRDQLRAG